MHRNRYSYFDEGALPTYNSSSYIIYFMIRTSILLVFMFLVLMPKISSSTATKYETAYACEGKTLTLECEPGDLISLIRANYGRFSITICNDHGNVEWSVNCRSSKSLRVLNLKCAHKQNCSVLASTSMFGDPCPGTHKYLEAHYKCISATLTLTTTTRPSPSWLITQQPPPSVHNSWTTATTAITTSSSLSSSSSAYNKFLGNGATNDSKSVVSVVGVPSTIPKLPSGGGNSEIHLAGRPPSGVHRGFQPSISDLGKNNANNPTVTTTIKSTTAINKQVNYNMDVNHILGNHSYDINNNSYNNNNNLNNENFNKNISTQSTELVNDNSNNNSNVTQKNYDNSEDTNIGSINSNSYCGPTTSRNLFWNRTRVGDVNVQQCPDGTNGIAKWRCIVMPRSALNHNSRYDLNSFLNRNSYINKKFNYINNHEYNSNDSGSSNNNNSKDNGRLINNDCDNNNNKNNNNNNNDNNNKNNNDNCDKTTNTIKLVNGINNNKFNNGNISINSINNDKDYLPIWHPQTPDLTQCRSVWFSNLENDVNKRDSSLVSIANDLSTLTSSQVLYGGDMLVTTKIIQTMSEKMPDDIETFPDQRQREAIISELLTGVVKIGSNLLDKSQQPSWLDLSHEDQMRVATSLLTGLESNAFLLADSITREKTATYPTKNILLSVRVLDSKNLPMNEIFPNDKNAENWDISHDRIELPRGALYENSDGGLVRIIFVAFDRLESILRPSYENLDFKIARNNVQKSTSSETQNIVHRMQILNSKVISASLGKGRHIQLSQPIKLVLKHLKTENVTNPTCVFWNYIDHAWSSDGCYLESTNRTHSICMCNHLTNFAILMDVKEEHNKSLLSIFDNNLGIFIYISITICIIFIIIAILTLKLFNGAFIKSTRTSIYKNIYVCLFIIEILSLVGVKQNETSLLCGFTTAFLHCFILSAIAWLFFEGFQLYVTLTTEDILLEVENSSKIIWYYLLSYGLSFTIVAISLAIDPGTYTQSDFCVLMEANALFYSTFMTPIAIFVLGTLVCIGLACYDMCRKKRSQIKNKEHTRLSTVRFDLRCSLLFLLILSADWVFAYLYLRRAKQEELIAFTYGYLFVMFNSLLGVYIFIFHCIQNEKIRREYRKYIRQNSWLPKCLRCSKTSSITSSTSQHHHPPHHHLSQSQLQQQQISNQTSTHHYETSSISGNQKNPIIIANNNLDSGCNNKENIITPGIITNAGTPITRKYLPIDGYTTEIIDCSQITVGGTGGAVTSGIGTLQRNSSGGIKAGSIQGNTVIRTPSGGHASPTSSIGSAHLIYNSKHLQQQQQQQQPNECWNYSLRQQNTMSENNKNLNTYDDKFLFYDCKSKRLKNHHPTATTPRNLSQQNKRNPSSVICNSTGITGDMTNISGLANHENFPYQQHEYFYWTEKSHGHGQSNIRKQINNNGESNKGHNFYPSYKKTRQYSQQYYPTTGSGRVYNKLSDCEFQLEKDSNCPSSNLHEDSNLGNSFSSNSGGPNSIGANKYYESSGGFNRYPNSASHSSKNQLSSDEDQCGNDSVSSHNQLMQQNNIGGSGNNCNVGVVNSNSSGNASVGGINNVGVSPSVVLSIGNKFQSNSIVMGICGTGIIADGKISGTPYHRHPHYDNKHSNCDLVNDFENSPKNTISVTGNTGLDVYYNHHGGTVLDEPVYEEILNSRALERMSDRDEEEDRDVNDDEEEEDDDEDEDNDNDEDDDDDDDDDDRLVPKNIKQQQLCGNRITVFTPNLSGMNENEEDCIMNEQQYNRLRRIIANKENEERGRFRRQDFKSNNSNESGILPGNLFTYINKRPSPLSMSVLDDTITDNTFIESQKQQQLPFQLNKQQKLIQSPSEQQQIVSRNISAMLDDNNTVRCYLEPLQK